MVSEPSSGSKALSAFIAGTGNVLLAYESDALNAFVSGQKLQIVQPPQNLLIQNPAALTTTGSTNTGAIAFYKYLFSKAGQQIWLAAALPSDDRVAGRPSARRPSTRRSS